jgi:hypothetical protein
MLSTQLLEILIVLGTGEVVDPRNRFGAISGESAE